MAEPMFPFLEDPRLQAAGMSMALNLMQPPAWGDTFMSQFGRALGSGAETVGRQEELDRREAESESKTDLRSAQAQAAEARASAAGARLGTQEERVNVARERLGLAQMMEEGRNQRNRLSRILQAQRDYSREATEFEKNNLLLPSNQKKTMPSFQDWLRGKGLDKELGFGMEGNAGTPPAATLNEDNLPVAQPGTQRAPGLYKTPRGTKRWTGTEWVDP